MIRIESAQKDQEALYAKRVNPETEQRSRVWLKVICNAVLPLAQ
jgi:hypothetical protein